MRLTESNVVDTRKMTRPGRFSTGNATISQLLEQEDLEVCVEVVEVPEEVFQARSHYVDQFVELVVLCTAAGVSSLYRSEGSFRLDPIMWMSLSSWLSCVERLW